MFPDFAAVAVHGHVFLFVDGFEFGVEEAHDGVAEAFGFYGEPLVEPVGGNVVDVDGLFDPGVGVGALGSDGADEFVVFVRNGVACGYVGE